jgi:hypothetical protein
MKVRRRRCTRCGGRRRARPCPRPHTPVVDHGRRGTLRRARPRANSTRCVSFFVPTRTPETTA